MDKKTEALSRELGQSGAEIHSHDFLMPGSIIFLPLPSPLSLTNRKSFLTPAPVSHPLLRCCDADGLGKPIRGFLYRVRTQL